MVCLSPSTHVYYKELSVAGLNKANGRSRGTSSQERGQATSRQGGTEECRKDGLRAEVDEDNVEEEEPFPSRVSAKQEAQLC